jgi:thioredoxin-like negative regulator of GroEL
MRLAIAVVLGSLALASCSKPPPPPAPPPPPPPKGPEKVATFCHAQNFTAQDYLVPDHVVLVEFYGDFEPASAKFAPELEKLAARNDKVLLRRADLGNWNSKAAAQARQEFQMSSLPLVCVFDGKGKLVEKLTGTDLSKVEAAVTAALGR